MRASPVWLCCWPGLPRLWLLGDWPALALAIGFGAVLNLLLVSSIVWTEVVPSSARTMAWLIVAGLWMFSAIRSHRILPELCSPKVADDRGLFIQAQGEYLKGHWFEAESLLQQLLQVSRHDIDAQLMLATLLRRTHRYDEAQARLDLIDQFEAARKWRWEIETERRLLKASQTTNNQTRTSTTSNGVVTNSSAE